jgi:hypothetical protein
MFSRIFAMPGLKGHAKSKEEVCPKNRLIPGYVCPEYGYSSYYSRMTRTCGFLYVLTAGKTAKEGFSK